MSFIKRWDADQLIQSIRSCHAQAASSYNDGFTAWACKQDLYRVKFELDELLNNTPTFADEQQWLDEQQAQREKNKIWKMLNEVPNV